MRKLSKVMVALAAVVVLAGCGTKATYTQMPGTEHVNPAGTFSVGEITDTSKFEFSPKEKNPFKLTDAMHDALKSELEKKTAFADPGDYTLNIDITGYMPGNAFYRWLAPGAGRTELNIVCSVANPEGKILATIPINRYVAAGGGYTIGAYKYVFTDVAETLVKTLRNEDKRKSPDSVQ